MISPDRHSPLRPWHLFSLLHLLGKTGRHSSQQREPTAANKGTVTVAGIFLNQGSIIYWPNATKCTPQIWELVLQCVQSVALQCCRTRALPPAWGS